MRIDLHAHTRHSDGTDSPTELVRAAAAAGLDVVALTDHDVTTGWSAAAAAAREEGIGLVPGLELSCRLRGTSVHLLAYLPDPTHPGLVRELDQARESRRNRMRAMVQRLSDAGFPVSLDAVLAQAQTGATLGRPHLADALVAAGRYPDRAAAFADALHDGSPYYVTHYAPALLDAVSLVVDAGGVPVIAHVFAQERGPVVTEADIAAAVDAGLAGLEVWHPDHDAAAEERAVALCRRFALIPTGSSDYHGTGKPNRLGERTTPLASLEEIRRRGTGAAAVGLP